MSFTIDQLKFLRNPKPKQLPESGSEMQNKGLRELLAIEAPSTSTSTITSNTMDSYNQSEESLRAARMKEIKASLFQNEDLTAGFNF